VLLLDPWTIVRTCSSDIYTLGNNNQLLIICWLRLRYSNGILDALDHEQKMDDEERDSNVRGELLDIVSVNTTRVNRKVHSGEVCYDRGSEGREGTNNNIHFPDTGVQSSRVHPRRLSIDMSKFE
jgi:hypothetical protein